MESPPKGGEGSPGDYRPDVDGLRAVAVLAVVLYHVNRRLLPGGFLGVDIFFVISGFLITRNILRDLDRGRFSLREFYRRRIKRIAPAMLVVIAATLVGSSLLLLPEDVHDTARSAIFSVAALSNVYFWRYLDQGYFAQSSAQVPLLHLWSLGVEEQFYLLWPTTLKLAHRWIPSRRKLAAGMLGVAALSFVLGDLVYPKDPSFAYYMLPTRAGELLLGAVATILLADERRLKLSSRMAGLTGTLALGTLIASLWVITEYQPFPGWRAAVATAATAIVIVAGDRQDQGWTRLLRWKPFVWTGLVSYSAYLWHWPLLALYRYGYGEPGPVAGLVMGVLTFVLAWWSYEFVEQPARRSKASLPRVFTTQYVLPAGALLGAALFLMYPHLTGLPLRSQAYGERLAATRDATRPAYDYDWVCQRQEVTSGDLSDPRCVLGDSGAGEPVAVLWGDSHAAHYVGMVAVFARRAGFRFRNVEVGSCPPLEVDPAPYVQSRRLADCRRSLDRIRPEVERFPVVMLSSAWLSYGSGYLDAFRSTVSHLVGEGKQVIILGEVPPIPGYDRRCREKALTFPFLRCPNLAVPLDSAVARTNQALRALAVNTPGVSYFDPNDYLCAGVLCAAYAPSGEPIYYDETHLTLLASERLGETITSRAGVPPAFHLSVKNPSVRR